MDLSRTEAALLAYDAHRTEANARAVGVAYGEDTKDINDPETCASCIGPGKPKPAGHPDEPFVRRMVRKWKAGEI